MVKSVSRVQGRRVGCDAFCFAQMGYYCPPTHLPRHLIYQSSSNRSNCPPHHHRLIIILDHSLLPIHYHCLHQLLLLRRRLYSLFSFADYWHSHLQSCQLKTTHCLHHYDHHPYNRLYFSCHLYLFAAFHY